MQKSISDAVNAARNNLVSVIIQSGGDPYATALAKNQQDTLQNYKSLFDNLMK